MVRRETVRRETDRHETVRLETVRRETVRFEMFLKRKRCKTHANFGVCFFMGFLVVLEVMGE